MAILPVRPGRRRPSALHTAVITAVLAAVCAVAVVSKVRHRTWAERLADLAPPRAILPLTSLPVKYRRCEVVVSDSSIPGAVCAGSRVVNAREVERLAADIQARMEAGPDAEATVAWAMMELNGFLGEPDAAEAISLLDSALPLTHDSANVFADMAAAHLVFAAEAGSYVDLEQALDYSNEALELEPLLLPALFNRALAMRLLGMDKAAVDAWKRYGEAATPTGVWAWLPDRDASWRREAEHAASELALVGRPKAPTGTGVTDSALAAFAREHPQEARETGWNELLPAWGNAVLAGDTAVAERNLRQAEILGTAIVSVKGDGSLDEQVRHLLAIPRSGAALRNAADAHRLDGALSRAWLAMDEISFAALLDSLSAYPLFPSHKVWVEVRHNSMLIDAGHNADAEHLLDSLQASIDTLRYPAAAAFLDQNRGTLLTHNGDFGKAPAEYLRAESKFARIGEDRNQGSMGAYISDTERSAGNRGAADEWMLRASVKLQPFGPTKLHHDLLRQASNVALRNGFERAMLDLAEEDVQVTKEYGKAPLMGESRANLAILLAAHHDEQGALRELAKVESIARGQSPFVQRFFASNAAYVRGLLRLAVDPNSTLAWADTLIADQSRAMWPMRGYALRARALVALRDTAGAREAIDAEFEALNRARNGLGGGAADREVVEGDVREAVQQLAQLLAAAGRNRDAIMYLDRAEAAFSPVQLEDRLLPARVPEGRVIVRPLRVGNALLIWVFAGDSITVVQRGISAVRLTATIDTLKGSFANRWNADAQLRTLYRILIEPIERQLGRDGTEVVFVTDAQLAWLPMDALLAADGQPLLRSHPVSRALSVASAAAPRDRARPASGVFLAPAYPPGGELTPLPQARAEVDSASAGYVKPTVLDSLLGAAGFAEELRHHPLVHFAGHAVTDDLHPERSYLALGADRLYAAAIDTLKLKNVQLVVLSACSSLAGGRNAAGFTGLSGAFLGAGAGGLVGSLWKVDDAATLALMTEFYRELRTTGDPALALQRAKISLYNSKDAVQGAPFTWAAFQYVSR